MTLTLIGTLVVLALVDSTSFGTLLIPLWFLVAPRRPPARAMLTYGAVVIGAYALIGVVLLAVADRALPLLRDGASSVGAAWVALVVGVGLFIGSFALDRKRSDGESRALRWRERALHDAQGLRKLATLALVAVAAEIATMLPYLAAIGLLAASSLPFGASVGVLAVYCLVMIAPAAALWGLRELAGARADALLARLEAPLVRWADSALGWIVGIAGFLLARHGAAVLFMG